jgi:hypothetical protein
MWITTDPPHGKKSKRTCKCGASLQTSGQQYERNPAPLTRHTRINQPDFTLPNLGQPNQESPPRSLQRTKLNKVGELLKGASVTQAEAIRHSVCPLETTGLASPRSGSHIRHGNVGPLPSNMAILQSCIPCRYICTSETLQSRITREGVLMPQNQTHRTQNITSSLPT